MVGVAAVVLITLIGCAAVGGFYIGADSSASTQTAYNAGYSQASYNFCNVKFTTGKGSKPYTDDMRHYDFVPAHTIIADAVCTDDQVRSWNEAQSKDASPLRACKLDFKAAEVVGVLSAAECIATESLN
jgi:hypothetical protein